MKKDKHPWITNKSGQIFNQPFFDIIDLVNWNEELPAMYSRINAATDERSFVILLSIVVEYHLDKLLKIILPGYEKMCDKGEMTFSLKISLLESLNIIPSQIFIFADFIRKIRNEFAHNLQIDSLAEIANLEKRKSKLLLVLDQLVSDYKNHLVYSKNKPNDLRLKFKDIAHFVIQASREYEPNFIALRKEIDSHEFIEYLSTKNKNKLLEITSIE